ncbi:MAG: CarD family transcriptional regulator [Burkholderiaceae bacterium]|nr:CarD family transcriptional regulator [Microbacteriaceae bacterium]
MIFEVGETIVYPRHGAATITAVQNRTIKGVEKKYVTLKIHQMDLTIDVPVSNADVIGLRDVIDSSGVEAMFDVLRGDVEEEAGNWSRRFKANMEKMGTGDINRIAEVVRDLWRRDQEQGISLGEKNLLAKARQILISELALALKASDDDALAALDEVLTASVSA